LVHREIDAQGIKLHVVEQGNGPAVLFCHGFPAIWSSWQAQMDAIAEAGWRAIALDMRGYGESEAPANAEAYTAFQCVGDLIGVLDALNIATAVVVGHDFGANVAWQAAMMRPDRFTAVFGISVPFLQPQMPSFLDRLRQADKTNFYMFAQMRPEADAAWADAAHTIPGMYYWTSAEAPKDMQWDPFDPSRGLLRNAPEPLRSIDQGYLNEAVESFTRTGFHGGLNYYRAIDTYSGAALRPFAGATIRQPSFFLTGKQDGLNNLHAPTEAMLRPGLPDLRGFVTIDDAGHWPQLETADKVNDALLGFLAGLEQRAGTSAI
jgi:pimeloyl-ACP methyl ester carboxylesterase